MIFLASELESSFLKSEPDAPPSSKLENAGKSLATIGVLHAIASARMIPKDSPPVFGAIYNAIDLKNCVFSDSESRPRNVMRYL